MWHASLYKHISKSDIGCLRAAVEPACGIQSLWVIVQEKCAQQVKEIYQIYQIPVVETLMPEMKAPEKATAVVQPAGRL
jgi:hypothetical protein